MGTNTRRKDGRIGDRITFDHSEDALRVDIRQHIPAAQMSLLSIWMVAQTETTTWRRDSL